MSVRSGPPKLRPFLPSLNLLKRNYITTFLSRTLQDSFPILHKEKPHFYTTGTSSFYLDTLSYNDTVPLSKLPEFLARPLWESPLSQEYVPFTVSMEAADSFETLVCSTKSHWITLHNTIRSREEYVYYTTFKNVSSHSRN